MNKSVVIAGVGSFVPDRLVSNEHMLAVVGQKDARWIDKHLGIKERRLLHYVDPETGKAVIETDDLVLGVPVARNKRSNLLVKLTPKMPSKLSNKAREMLTKLKEEGI